MSDPTIRDMVHAYLTAGGHDGLASREYGCGCFVDDLMPCEAPGEDCVAGRKVLRDDGDWIMVPASSETGGAE